ncbi:hypothetical protein [Kitasatospora kifunensis]|uniref:Tol biopolymer transport system component n=1 Tax=Kitasatospora kifunensis TaxID=58351 RepID=A0A7W7R926_KITKI|nr:hypothetical protein [Kitasatospora kifunensis]MBB4927579.1 Tol biopolymer transport system component [Kitasatospora kifunensis]
MIGATGTPRSVRRSARAAVAILLSLAAAVVTLGAADSDGQSNGAAPVATPAAGRIVFAGTDHRSLGQVTGTAASTPLFGPGPAHFDVDPSARGGLLVFTSLRDEPKPQVYLRDESGAVRKLTTGMDTADPSLTPDGKAVVFDALEPGGQNGQLQRDLWLVNSDGTGLRRLTDTSSNETHPTVSPDGQWIAYDCDADPAHIQVFVMPLAGGASRQITTVTTGSAIDPAWNPVNDDAHREQIVYTWDQGGTVGPSLRLTSPTGGDRAFFPGTGSTWQSGSAAWLPDGSGVLFVSPNKSDGTLTATQNVYRAPTCSCTPPQLVYSGDRLIETPTWLGTQSQGGPVVGQTSAAASNVADVEDVLPDGTDPRDLGISVLSEDPAASTDTNPADDPLFNPHAGYDPWFERQGYTPDGRNIVVTRFEESPAGRIERIWLADADGSNPQPMNLAGRGPNDWDTDPTFSPDGKLIAFTRTSPGGVGTASGPGRIVIAQVATGAIVGTIEPPADQPTASEAEPAFSPDGKLIAFTRTEVINGNGGNKHVWTAPVNALDQQSDLSLTACPGACDVIDDSPAFSPDARSIAFNRKGGDGGLNERDGVLVTSTTGSGCTVILPTGLSQDKSACGRQLPDTSTTGPFQPRDVSWTADGSQLVLTSRRALPANSPEALSVYDFATGKLTPVDWRLPGRQKEPSVQQSVHLSLSAPASTPSVFPDGSTAVPITVTNHGPAPSPGTVFTASVPAGARLGALTASAGQCDAGALRCELGTLAPGASVQLTATVIGTQLGDQQLGWYVAGAVVDPNPEDNTAQTLVPVVAAPPPTSPPPSPSPSPSPSSPPASPSPTPAPSTPAPPPPSPPAPSLSPQQRPPAPKAGPEVSISAQPQPGYVGGHVTVTYTVRNTGQALASGLRLTLGLPAGVPTEPLPPGCSDDACELGDLSPGGTEAVQVVLSPDAALRTTVTTVLTTTGTDANPGRHRASTLLRILQPTIVAVPPIGKPGFVTSVRGKDFPPGVPVTFNWQPGITAAAAPTVPAADGTFAGQLLILAKDETGPRTITASGPGFSPVTCPFLVVAGSIGPPEEVQRR